MYINFAKISYEKAEKIHLADTIWAEHSRVRIVRDFPQTHPAAFFYRYNFFTETSVCIFKTICRAQIPPHFKAFSSSRLERSVMGTRVTVFSLYAPEPLLRLSFPLISPFFHFSGIQCVCTMIFISIFVLLITA